MPSYNAQSYIEQSINSVLQQTYKNLELLITDDRSTDQTVEIINAMAERDQRIKLEIVEVNGGAGLARNNAISRAKGQYIAFLDSDDLWAIHKLEKQIAFMQKNDIAFSYTGYQKFQEKNLLGVVNPPSQVNYKELLDSNVIGCLSAVYDCQKLGKQYMPQLRKRQDMALWLTILKQTEYAFCLQETLAYYRVGVGISSNKFEMVKWQWRLYRRIENLSLLRSLKHTFFYMLKGFVKHCN